MNFKVRLLVPFFLFSINTSAMNVEESKDTAHTYRLAQQEDTPALLDLINSHAIKENHKIVILPKKFREGALQAAIQKKRMFVAEDLGKIIGFKKLYIIDNHDEKHDILKNEIRCFNNDANCAFAGSVYEDGSFVEEQYALPSDCYNICMYNGSDFTLPDYRCKGINSRLTQFALHSYVQEIKKQLEQKSGKSITMVYGITKANAGENPGASDDRTVSIIKQFKEFIREFHDKKQPIILQHQRYHAFMPTFDFDSEKLEPKSDEHSVAGFGCLLTTQIKESHA